MGFEELRQLVLVPGMEAIAAHAKRLRRPRWIVAAPIQRNRKIHQLDKPIAQVVRGCRSLGLLGEDSLHMPPLHQPHRLVAMLFEELLDDPAIDLLRTGREIKEIGRTIPRANDTRVRQAG